MSRAKSGNIEGIYRLSPTQEGLLFHTLYAPESGVYCVQYLCRLSGELDEELFESAWQETLNRHDAPRALFTWERREHPLQVIRKRVRLPFSVVDWSHVDDERTLETFLDQDRLEGFELDSAPLMRVALFRLGPTEHRLVWSFHHLLLDGWSQRLFLSEVLERYDSLVSSRTPVLSHAHRYGDYVEWLNGRDLEAARAFWKARLAGFRAPTDTRLPRPLGPNESGYGVTRIRLSQLTSSRLESFARSERVTLNTVFRGAWAVLLSRYSGEEDVVFGATVSGRSPEIPGIEDVVGLLINTLPVRATVAETTKLGPWLRTLQSEQLETGPYEFMSLADVQRVSEVPRGRPLFESILVYENSPPSRSRGTTLELADPRYIEHSHFPLALLVLPEREIELTLVYDGQRFASFNMERLASHLKNLLESIAGVSARSIGDLEMLTASEAQTLLVDWTRSSPTRSHGKTAIELFEQRVDASPDAVAVTDDGGALRYDELKRAAQDLARKLVSLTGDAPDAPVAIYLERSRAMAVGILGILYAGHPYVPIDPAWPRERVAFVVDDAGAATAVTTSDHRDVLADIGTDIICLDDKIDSSHEEVELPEVDPSRLAYILYTSGSTGRPKGVEIAHENLVSSTDARFDFYPEIPARFLLLSSFTFDSSIAGIFWTLCGGGTLVLPPSRVEQDVHALATRIAEDRVSHTLCLPSLYALLLDLTEPGELQSLRTVVVAGEACPAELAARHAKKLPDTVLYNEYGPTEATVWATAHRARTSEPGNTLPIGRPIAGARVFVVNRALNPVPVGVPGELLLGGAGLARGYLNRPELTAERFLDFRENDGEPIRVYRTGDLVRWREDGLLEFLGREDRQVKIRGYRIELEEIEAVLNNHSDLARSAVVARSSEETSGHELLEAEDLLGRLRALGKNNAERLLSDVENTSEV